MRKVILSETQFKAPSAGWELPQSSDPNFQVTCEGAILSAAPRKSVTIDGLGVHTRNGDTIELHFRPLEREAGHLIFGFDGGAESTVVKLDLVKKRLSLSTSDWTRPQPVNTAAFKSSQGGDYVLRIEKMEGNGGRIKDANIRVDLNGEKLLAERDLNILPEIGVKLSVTGTRILVKRFVHSGIPSSIPEYLHVGGWQIPNKDSITDNLKSIYHGLEAAADKGVQLLVTPETSLTGLFPTARVTQNQSAIATAEAKLRKFIRQLKNAPYLVVGLPVWESTPGHRRKKTRYNASRVYQPDGDILCTHPKIHSCETEFWHGYRLNEFDIYGVPVSMHICHDTRYPPVWTLPVMFGARLVLHPANGGDVRRTIKSIDAFEVKAKTETVTSHAFYMHINGGGGSYIVGPQKYDNLIAVSGECRREVSTFPLIDDPTECLIDAKIRIHDAFGYWPVRSFRASEEAAAAYVALYKSMGGKRCD